MSEQLANGLAGVFIKLVGVENAGGLFPFGQEADCLLFFAFLGKRLEGLKTFFWSAGTALGFESGFHVIDGSGDKHVDMSLVPIIEPGFDEGVDG